MTALRTTSYLVLDLGELMLSRSGDMVTIGVETEDGIAEFAMPVEVAHHVWDWLNELADVTTHYNDCTEEAGRG